ncbi:tryptophan 7-halogenase [Tsuneonella suprasediminis]|uniref:Tryptophan 7-halogenase n=1 Tax=Tsuneonella suprasediminis TaxID=2306996 RepID=A0A419R3R6_9SPHN|nr:tryptophan halogenase family protein [Tsuneonella suprasediminis]RJX68726.1 tryptophan 7-halogenase [Tsuneonella suprasediminis]
MSDNGKPPRVVVLGGGSAGWITACLLHKQWAERGGSVTLVESPEIGIIGVGEGSTPQLKALWDHLGIDEAAFMTACDATYKLGIRFTGWSERPGFESYFHPFPSPVDLHTEGAYFAACALARRGVDLPVRPDRWFLAARLAGARKGPHPTPNFPFPPTYGYHFDAYKLGAFLRDWAVPRGVVHRTAKVGEVELSADGDVAALLTENGERIEGDLFVDCSGFAGVIGQRALGVRFTPFAENLFNDRAVVMPTAHAKPYRQQTDAIAMSAGWRWSIPLTTRVGNGYVYSSAHISDEDAEAELRTACNSEADARVLRMKVGRVEETWHCNCLSAGLAQGFIEPLEATALHIVISTALDFVDAFEAGGFTPMHRARFNAKTAARYEGIRDYIVAHYRMNQRTDTAYWRDNRANQALSDNLKAMITAWFTQGDVGRTNATTYGEPAYSAMSWHALFAGYGGFPDATKMAPAPSSMFGAFARVDDLLSASETNFERVST